LGSWHSLTDQIRIFERFYRVDESRSRLNGGHGLGLAIVKTLVEGMGGNITVQSKPDEGSTFTIILPR
jgi:signal transduction histidine kinase